MQKQTYLGRRTKAWSLFEQRINVVTIVLWAHVETSNFLTLGHLQSLTPRMVGWGSSAFCTICIGCVWWVCPYWPPPVHACKVIFLLVSAYSFQCASFSYSPQICQSVRPTCWSSTTCFRVWKSSTVPIPLHLSKRCRSAPFFFLIPSTLTCRAVLVIIFVSLRSSLRHCVAN